MDRLKLKHFLKIIFGLTFCYSILTFRSLRPSVLRHYITFDVNLPIPFSFLQSFDLLNKILSFFFLLSFHFNPFVLYFACYRRLNDKFGFKFFFYFMRMSTMCKCEIIYYSMFKNAMVYNWTLCLKLKIYKIKWNVHWTFERSIEFKLF